MYPALTTSNTLTTTPALTTPTITTPTPALFKPSTSLAKLIFSYASGTKVISGSLDISEENIATLSECSLQTTIPSANTLIPRVTITP